MRFRLVFAIFAFVSFGYSTQAIAAPCCAGSTAVPALITGDEARNLSLGVSYGSVIGDAPAAGEGPIVFRDSQSMRESKKTMTVNAATLLDGDRLQAGVTIPLIQNNLGAGKKDESKVMLGDASFTLGYETLPEWEYSAWKPRIFSFLQTTLPTGRPIYQSETLFASDVSGLGQYQIALGTIAIKRFTNWDANFVLKGTRFFGRSFESTLNGATRVDSSVGFASNAGVGYSFHDYYRVGASLGPDYQGPVWVENSGLRSRSSQKLVWNTGFTFTYLIGLNGSLVAGYNDQTLFGIPVNQSLSRMASLSYQQRFER